MAVKYVKDFGFDSGFGYTGSAGKTPVRAYMRGGAVKSKGFDNSTRNPISKFPDIAPAMVEKTTAGVGGKASETKKLASYNKPHSAGKDGAKVPMYANGGGVTKARGEKAPTKTAIAIGRPGSVGKPSPRSMGKPRMGQEQGYAEGGKVQKYSNAGYVRRSGPTTREATGPTSGRAIYFPNPFGKSIKVYTGPTGGAQSRTPSSNPYDIFGNENPNFSRQIAEMEDERRQQTIERARGGKVGKMQKYAKGGKVQKYANAGRVMVPSRPTGGPAGGRGAGAAPGSLASMRSHPNPAVAKQAFIKGQSRMPDVQSRYKDVVAYSDYNPEYDIRYDPNFEQTSKIEYARGGKVGKVMREYKAGKLHSGSKEGPVVKNPKQAVAIALSEARQAGAKIPKKKAMGGRACG